jgi:hypothetical protein
VLLRMIPEAIADTWDELREQIELAMPEDELNETTMSNLLQMLLTDRASCWVSYDKEDNNMVNFVVVLIPVLNDITGERNLLIYSTTNSENMDLKKSSRLWLEGFQALQKFAKANGFRKLVSYFGDENHRSLQIAKRFGADIKYYIEIDMAKEG